MTEKKYRIKISLGEYPSLGGKLIIIKEINVPIFSKDKGIEAYIGLRNLVMIFTKGFIAFDNCEKCNNTTLILNLNDKGICNICNYWENFKNG